MTEPWLALIAWTVGLLLAVLTLLAVRVGDWLEGLDG